MVNPTARFRDLVDDRQWLRPPVIGANARGNGTTVSFDVWNGRGRNTISIHDVDCPPEVAGDITVPILGRFSVQQRRRVLSLAPIGHETHRRWKQAQPFLERALNKMGRRPGSFAAPRRRAALGTPPTDRPIAAMFSAGLDSFHVALRDPGAVGALVFVHGFDVSIDDHETRALVIGRVRAAAEALELPLVEVSTDLRSWTDGRASWTRFANGGIEAVALALCGRFREVWYGASVVDAVLVDRGVKRDFGNEWTTVIRRDGDRSRPEKLAAIVHHRAVREHLRVCWQNVGAYNCGECEKCIRTMITAAALGVLDDIETLPHELDLEAVRALPCHFTSERAFVQENIVAARANGADELAGVLERLYEETEATKWRPPSG